MRPLPFFDKFRKLFFGEAETSSSEFKACLAMMAARLEALLSSTVPVSTEPWSFIKESWADEETTKDDEPTGQS
jgi:hypothetical protein